MSHPHTMQSIEARLFRAWWNDGQLDLFFGVGAIGVAAFWAVDLVALGAAVPAMLALLWTPVRKAVIEPRAGWVEFGAGRVARSRRSLTAALATGVGVLAVIFVGGLFSAKGATQLASDLSAAIPAVSLALMAVMVAAGLRLGRFLWYAAALVVAGVAFALGGYEPEVSMFAAGTAVAAAGTILLARFFRRSHVEEMSR